MDHQDPHARRHVRPTFTVSHHAWAGQPTDAVLADKAYDSNDLRDRIEALKAEAVWNTKVVHRTGGALSIGLDLFAV